MSIALACRLGAGALALCLAQLPASSAAFADAACDDRFDHAACAAADDAGSAPPATLPKSSVGNPISLLTGNKHQRETDHAIPGSRLAYDRHYNSSRRDADVGLGRGWSDTYATRLFAAGDGRREIVQSNGRRIGFTAIGPAEAPVADTDSGTGRWHAPRTSDGIVVRDAEGVHRWHLPDGRTLRFHGGFLARIDWPDGDFLKLRYRQRRVETVTDAYDRTLRFEYTPARPALPSYDERGALALPGHLAALVRPDGTRVTYAYDRNRNLVEARYPDGSARTYHYEDDVWPNHLTGITDRRGVRTNTWRYDEAGHAISSALADGRESLAIERGAADAASGIGTTTVTTGGGARSAWYWRERESTGAIELLAGDGDSCRSCPPTGERHVYDEHGLPASTLDAAGVGELSRRDERGRLLERRRRFADGSSELVEARDWQDDGHRLAAVRTPGVRPGHERELLYRRGPDGLVTAIVERGFSPVVERSASGGSEGDGEVRDWTPIERTTRIRRQDGRVSAIDGPRGDVEDVWRFERDARGELVAISRPDGRRVAIEARDAAGRVTRFRIGTEPAVTLDHDGEGRVVRIDHRGLSLGIERDPEGRVSALVGPWGRRQTFEHDGAGALVAFADDAGRRVEQRHDEDGRLVARDLLGADGEFVASVALYRNLAGDIDAIETRAAGTEGGTPSERRVGFERDALGTLLGLVDADGNRTSVVRDERTRRVTVTLPDGSHRESVGDATGRPARHVDANGNVTRFWRDDFGRTVARHHPDTGLVRFEHAEGDRWIARIAADGRRTERVFDAAGRLLEERLPDDTLRFAYDPASGALTMAAGDAAVERFAYSSAGDLTRHVREIDDRAFTTTFTHDEHGRLASRTLPGGLTLRYHYHVHGPNAGRLRAITRSTLFGLHQETLVAEIDLDPRDGASGHLSHNGLRTTHRFAPNGELVAIDVDEALRLRYRHDAAGDIVGIDERGTLSSFRYANGRLATADTAAGRFRYTWDAAGNRTSSDVGRERDTPYRRVLAYPDPGEGNRLQGVARPRGDAIDAAGDGATRRFVASDPNGNPDTTADGRRLRWNARGRLASVSVDGRTVAEYAYNGFGERVKKVTHDDAGTRITYFLYDGHTLTAEIDAERDAIRHYVHVAERPVALIDGDATHALHGDHLGTVRLATDDDGAASWRAEHDPFGAARVTLERVRMPLRLPGQYADAESGLHYNLHRYYDPGTGRYLSPDPTGLAGGDNAFAYADGSPISGSDSLGLAPRGGPTRPDDVYPEKPVAEQDFGERLQTTLAMVLEYGNLPGQIVDAIAEQITPEAIGTTVAVVGLFVALQATPLGWFADAILVGAAWFEFGSAALDLVRGLIDLVDSASDARTRADLCAAADRLSGRIAGLLADLSGDIALFGAAGAADGARLIRRLFSSNRDDALAARPRPCRKAGEDGDGCGVETRETVEARRQETLLAELEADWSRLTDNGTRGPNSSATSMGYAVLDDGTAVHSGVSRQNFTRRWARTARNEEGSVRRVGENSFVIDDPDAYIDMVRETYRNSPNSARLHDETEQLIRNYIVGGGPFSGSDGLPGLHAEVRVLNDLFNAAPGVSAGNMTIGTVRLSPDDSARPFVACVNCSGILPLDVNVPTGRQ